LFTKPSRSGPSAFSLKNKKRIHSQISPFHVKRGLFPVQPSPASDSL
jgi:hypothetical protein